MLLRLVSSIVRRVKNALVNYEVRKSCVVQGRLMCGQNALVLNHGPLGNVVLADGAIIDGTLECYERGKLSFGEFSYIGRSRIFCAQSVTIGRGVLISDSVYICDTNAHPMSAEQRLNDIKAWHEGKFPDLYTNVKSAPVVIEDGAWIGALAVIGPGVTIGKGAIVAAGTFVRKDVPAGALVMGPPGQIVHLNQAGAMPVPGPGLTGAPNLPA